METIFHSSCNFLAFCLMLIFSISSSYSQISATTSDKNNAAVIEKQMTSYKHLSGKHAPDANDPDYEVKKAEWIKKHPNEYKYSIEKQSNKTMNVQKRLGEHAPDYNDTDYAAKKAEWIKNYPEEYKLWMEQKLEKKQSN